MDKTDRVLVDFNITRELGLAESIVVAYIKHYHDKGVLLNDTTRTLAKTIPLSKSTIAKALRLLITDTYLTLSSEGFYILTDKFFNKFYNERT